MGCLCQEQSPVLLAGPPPARACGGWYPDAKIYCSSGVTLIFWQAAGNSKSCRSSTLQCMEGGSPTVMSCHVMCTHTHWGESRCALSLSLCQAPWAPLHCTLLAAMGQEPALVTTLNRGWRSEGCRAALPPAAVGQCRRCCAAARKLAGQGRQPCLRLYSSSFRSAFFFLSDSQAGMFLPPATV